MKILWVIVTPTLMLNLATETSAASFRVSAPELRDVCFWTYEGDVEIGDVDHIRGVFDSAGFIEYPSDRGVCLDSPGGAYIEGIRLALLFREYQIGTRVLSGKSCYSACAIAFMGGTSSSEAIVGRVPDRAIGTDGMVAALPKRHRDVPAWRLLIATKRKGRQNEGHDYRC